MDTAGLSKTRRLKFKVKDRRPRGDLKGFFLTEWFKMEMCCLKKWKRNYLHNILKKSRQALEAARHRSLMWVKEINKGGCNGWSVHDRPSYGFDAKWDQHRKPKIGLT